MRLINFADPIDNNMRGIFLSRQQLSYDPNSKEYWIDLTKDHSEALIDSLIDNNAKRIVFFDILHADPVLPTEWINTIRKTSEKCPTQWITLNKLKITNLPSVHYDFMWNRCKSIHLDGPWQFKWKNNGISCGHHALQWQPRSYQYLAPVNSSTLIGSPFNRIDLLNFLKQYSGFYSNKSENKYLETDSPNDNGIGHQLGNVPVAKHYYDNSYVSCQIESQCLTGGGIVISEKTYDHMIQGRLVLNFGPQNYYQTLQQDGWKLWDGIDLSWDSIANDSTRWCKYLECLKNLFDLNMADLHDIFLLNKPNLEHNWQQLYDRPYDFID
jgi:hypothetical protein